ncbi:uncharacterized protein [Heptranchias perlo]|uniref:uncharacterized protein n=1 Tax=Heptranchias perlo TaxID=212740 RepID=UPI00355967AF
MWTLWFSLLFLLWAPTSDGTELNNDALAQIVSNFTDVALEFSQSERRQFAFLMVLTEEECRGSTIASYIPYRDDGLPYISTRVSNDLKPKGRNYIALYPVIDGPCTEYVLLRISDEERKKGITTNVAQRFAELVQKRIGNNVGCVIFYSRLTPCTNFCFSSDPDFNIVTCLREPPFSTIWKNRNIHKYFVYSEGFGPDTKNQPQICDKLGEVAGAGFQIRRCDGNEIRCRICTQPDYCLDPQDTEPPRKKARHHLRL